MEIVNTNQAPAAIGPYVQAMKIDNIVYTSGQIALVPETNEVIVGGIEAQTEQVLKNLKAVLVKADADMNTVIKTTCFLKNMNDFALFNSIYEKHFGTHKPARSCVAVAELPKNVLCEVEAIAFVKK